MILCKQHIYSYLLSECSNCVSKFTYELEHLVETVTYLLAQCRMYFLFMIPVVGSQHSSMIDTASNLLYDQLVSEK